ncbi:MAG TPA: hypothetical protein VIJ43_04975 [Burkholderiales bacterium]
MRGLPRMHLPARQRGAVLLIMLALVSVMFIYVVVAGLNRSAADMAQARAQKTAAALAQAKEALIAFAVTYADDPSHTADLVPGFLPCPELVATASNEGVAASTCGSRLVSQIGRLPWRTLALDALRDGWGECLWYAVSGTYKNNPNGVTTNAATSNMMNWDNNGQFEVMAADGATYLTGAAADNRAVAVIFAPGSALGGQNRTPVANSKACRGNYSAAAYLETAAGYNNSVVSATANAITTFIAGDSSTTFNDRLVYITRADIWNAVKKRSDFQNNLRALTRRAAECVAMYGMNNQLGPDLADKRLPWASPTSLTNYAVDTLYDDANSDLQGRLSFKVNTSRTSTSNQVSSGTSLFAIAPYCWYTAQELDWYEHWKDHLFYALAWSHRAVLANKPTSSPCTTCLTVNAAGSYAAVMIFAGEKLAGQSRNSLAEKGVMSNYLEGRNLSNDPNAGGNSNYEARNPLTAAFNDIIYPIDTSLPTVKCYSASSSTMVSVPAAPSWPAGPYAACP